MLICGSDLCPCVRRKCERYGKCEECIEHHKQHKKYPQPYCIRNAEKIATKEQRRHQQQEQK